MKVMKKRWGEVIIRKQGNGGKNHFDKSKSFSVQETKYNYTIEEYKELLEIITDLTESFEFKNLKMKLNKIR